MVYPPHSKFCSTFKCNSSATTSNQYNINKHFAFELAYQNWYQKQSDGFTFLDKNILKATLIQKIIL